MDLFTLENLIALLSLTALEIVLGIDNIIFLAILVAKLKPEQRESARKIGLFLAMVMRILLLLTINWISQLTEPLFSVGSLDVSGRSIILLLGGIFLVGKATLEIHDKVEQGHDDESNVKAHSSFAGVIVQIIIFDLIFSLDSVITAVGLAQNLIVMILGIVAAVGVMMVFSGPITRFIDKHPTFKILALAFLILVGVMLVAEGLGKHIEKGYIYFAMAFSFAVEALNTRMRRKVGPA